MKTILALTGLLVAGNCFSQNDFGVRFGSALANVSADAPLEDGQDHAGRQFGFFFVFQDSSLLFFQAGINYQRRGFELPVYWTGPMGEVLDESVIRYRFDYVGVPLNAGICWGNRLRGYARAGGIPAIHLRADVRTNAPGSNPWGEGSDFTEDVPRFDLAAIAAFGADFALGNRWRLFAEGAHQRSVTEISNPDFFEGASVRHYGTAFSMGIKYR